MPRRVLWWCSRILKNDKRVAVALGSIVFLVLCPFVYRNGMGEPDMLVTVAAAFQASLKGTGLSEPILYMTQGQPLYYELLFAWFRLSGASLDTSFLCLNLFAALTMAAIVALLFYLTRRLAGGASAYLSIVCFALAPMTLELGTYSHPQTLSVAILLASFVLLFFVEGAATGKPLQFVLPVAASLVTGSIALLVRLDAVILFPLLLCICILRRIRPKRAFLILIAYPMAVSLAAFALKGVLISGAARSGAGSLFSLWQSVVRFATDYGTWANMHTVIAGPGLGTWIVIVAAFAFAARNGDWRAIAACAVAFAPVVFYCTLNPPHAPFLSRSIIAMF